MASSVTSSKKDLIPGAKQMNALSGLMRCEVVFRRASLISPNTNGVGAKARRTDPLHSPIVNDWGCERGLLKGFKELARKLTMTL
ncbi:hypothetical protein TNCV_1665341 [Trichonephila clavipes]|nr:hypothetical protein TNCV_1665341 [Trichonephila clavipes]